MELRPPMPRLAAHLLAVTLPCLAATGALAGNDSTYTRHDYQACPEIESPEPDVITRTRCQGPAGITVTWTNEPDASSIDIGTRIRSESLGLGSFLAVGPTIEWRGPQGSRRPLAAIVRYHSGPTVGRLDRPKLVVYRLEPSGRSCIMAVIDGAPGANARAREIVDDGAQRFRCGVSRRLAR